MILLSAATDEAVRSEPSKNTKMNFIEGCVAPLDLSQAEARRLVKSISR